MPLAHLVEHANVATQPLTLPFCGARRLHREKEERLAVGMPGNLRYAGPLRHLSSGPSTGWNHERGAAGNVSDGRSVGRPACVWRGGEGVVHQPPEPGAVRAYPPELQHAPIARPVGGREHEDDGPTVWRELRVS